jgi:muconate cycloisomerase
MRGGTAIRLDIYRTAIPMRSFHHAAARRDLAEAVVVRLELSDGSVGWGETLPRPYVTGETLDSVVADIQAVLWPAIAGQTVETDMYLPDLPAAAEGRCINAARCAVELACLDAVARPIRTRIAARASGVLGSADAARTARQLRLMRLYGLRDFKLKLGLGEKADADNLKAVRSAIGKALAAGRCTLRVDVNGGWTADQTPARTSELAPLGVCVVEQPARCTAGELVELARRCELPLMADESLLTAGDARVLLAEPTRIWWNIRISKNGGIVPAMELAALASEHGVPVTIGAMVGESSILSAAQRRLLQSCPQPRFVEGNYGRLLLADDLTTRSMRFGYGGRLRPLRGWGLGVRIDPRRLERHARHVGTLQA